MILDQFWISKKEAEITPNHIQNGTEKRRGPNTDSEMILWILDLEFQNQLVQFMAHNTLSATVRLIQLNTNKFLIKMQFPGLILGMLRPTLPNHSVRALICISRTIPTVYYANF